MVCLYESLGYSSTFGKFCKAAAEHICFQFCLLTYKNQVHSDAYCVYVGYHATISLQDE